MFVAFKSPTPARATGDLSFIILLLQDTVNKQPIDLYFSYIDILTLRLHRNLLANNGEN
jgi:hypothetical protein